MTRLTSAVDVVEVAPGERVEIPVEVVNTGDVIDGMTARVLGLPAAHVRVLPTVLPLFPGASGTLVVQVSPPPSFPAGHHLATIQVTGRASGHEPVHHDVEVVVAELPALRLSATPSTVRARRRAVFTVAVHNEGNVPLDVALRATDTDRTLEAAITPAALRVPPGSQGHAEVRVRGPRMLMGTVRDRPLRVEAQAQEVHAKVPLVLAQRPLLSPGLLTALLLLVMATAWALVFVFGIRTALGAEPVSRLAPGSFFAATPTEGAEGGEGAAGAESADGADGAAGGAPAGAVPKDGLLPAGAGGTLTGTVRGATDGAGVGRITVDALREGRDGLVLAGSAASQADGTFTIAGLFPGQYYLRFTAAGYDTAWFPGATSQAGAREVRARPQEVADGLDIDIAGQPAAIRGTVDVGDVTMPVTTTVTARPAWLPEDDAAAAVTTEAAADGSYTLEGLAAPGTYQLTFVAQGYDPLTIVERVAGGQERYAQDARLSAARGEVRGVVTDGAAPLGGVTVATVLEGEDVTTGTPTIGQVGTFVVGNLVTPGTYVLTFTKTGFTTTTVVVDLTAGESLADLQVVMAGGAGVITGRVTDQGGRGLGGASVQLTGGPAALTASTLTEGAVGSFTLGGLGAQRYTITVSLDGYVAESRAVDLTGGTVGAQTFQLSPSVGTVQGAVLEAGVGVAGVEVTLTDGRQTWSTVSASAAGRPAGFYAFTGLAPGTYTVMLARSGQVVETAVVTVVAGGTASQDLRWPG